MKMNFICRGRVCTLHICLFICMICSFAWGSGLSYMCMYVPYTYILLLFCAQTMFLLLIIYNFFLCTLSNYYISIFIYISLFIFRMDSNMVAAITNGIILYVMYNLQYLSSQYYNFSNTDCNLPRYKARTEPEPTFFRAVYLQAKICETHIYHLSESIRKRNANQISLGRGVIMNSMELEI